MSMGNLAEFMAYDPGLHLDLLLCAYVHAAAAAAATGGEEGRASERMRQALVRTNVHPPYLNHRS